ncbi:hypothetical protein L211DRAFT_833103 [Terfezia boudieri ATCC MYA-4762]|uniref:Heterokaryon incompatibility domain-containing protein n=1 Tax=Terfezia boudieri ATCC MYA-4762 TaxID=1051890 RepID=A0A3N4MAL0_9PEZI|nr:hypothetical protein L211DRAFT_833103 [Terfezia boudieri ATCC MYA-4762]
MSKNPQVSLQRPYEGDGAASVLSPEAASIPCASLGHAGLLSGLNRILHTSYTLGTLGASTLLEDCISSRYDFGTAYAHLRPFWARLHWLAGDLVSLRNMFAEYEKNDQEDREAAQVKGTIVKPYKVPPRRVWDLKAHRVVPGWRTFHPYPRYWPVSHSWADVMTVIDTPVNQYEWPVPIPAGVTLEMVRNELLNLGAEYAWLDILCLRQRSPDPEKEKIRLREWEIDVPTIGNAYQFSDTERTVQYCNGLGRPFETVGWDGPRHWLNRAWTLQEINSQAIIGGVTEEIPVPMDAVRTDGDCTTTLRTAMEPLTAILVSDKSIVLFHILEEMKRRFSSGDIDKIAGLGYLLRSPTLPAYYESQSVEEAWYLLVDNMQAYLRGSLLFLFPTPGVGQRLWTPSWKQIEETNLLRLVESFLGNEPVYIRGDINAPFALHRGYRINKCSIRGLAVVPSEGDEPRRGKLEIKLSNGEVCTLNVKARHQHIIPDGSYTLAGSKNLMHWVVCRERQPWSKLTKVSVISAGQDFGELEQLRAVAEVGNTFL